VRFGSTRREAKTLEAADSTELEARAWRSLLAASADSGQGIPPDCDWLVRRGDDCVVAADAPEAARALLDLYAPLCAADTGRTFTIAHLGQSLDGFIATASGDSYYVTGPENVRHLHRLRALSSAIVVGAGTIERDDPQLTVRRVEGPNPVRVVLDPSARLDASRRVFTDGAAPTLVVHAAGVDAPAPGSAEIVSVPADARGLDLGALLKRLRERGLASVFVEGGGSTVSRFLEAGFLDRLHVALAPLVVGSGRPGLTLPARERIADCLRPAHRVFTMGGDVLFDCDLRSAARRSDAIGSLSRVF
jgi:diaminohydroxyphosphoribosylaminopyrimidine deaminase/5-amino-6-(5-phosphoribosylamino)uracil reductase